MSEVWAGVTHECIYYYKNGTSSVYFEIKYMDYRVIHRPFQHEDDLKTSGRTDCDFKHQMMPHYISITSKEHNVQPVHHFLHSTEMQLCSLRSYGAFKSGFLLLVIKITITLFYKCHKNNKIFL